MYTYNAMQCNEYKYVSRLTILLNVDKLTVDIVAQPEFFQRVHRL